MGRLKRRSFLAALLEGGCGIGAAAVGAIDWPPRAWGSGRAPRDPTAPGATSARTAAGDGGSPFERLQAAGVSLVARLHLTTAAEGDAITLPIHRLAVPARGTGRGGKPPASFDTKAVAVTGERDAIDVVATARTRPERSTPALACAIELHFAGWSRDVYVAFPGACYAGNRFESRYVAGYPPLLCERADIGPHVPPIIADVPRLDVRQSASSALALAATDLATPAAAFFLPGAHLGIIVLIDPASPFGWTGFRLSEQLSARASTLEIVGGFVYPARDPERLRAADWAWPEEAIEGARPSRGDGRELLTMRARLFAFDCDGPPAVFGRLFEVRKQLTGKERAGLRLGGDELPLPFSAAFAVHEERVNRRFVDKPGFYALSASQRHASQAAWQSGWCGGLAGTFPLLAAGSDRSRARALATTAFVLAGGQAPSGLFHAFYDGPGSGKGWVDDGPRAADAAGAPAGLRNGFAARWHLLRRSADTLFYLVKTIALLERGAGETAATDRPRGADARWTAAARRCADAFVRIWERNRQLGQFVDVESGELIVGGSTSAGIAPAALALAAALFKEPRYLEVAAAAAEHYHERYVRAGLTCGGPADALQTPDGESAGALLESFVTLFEATRQPIWIERARDAAHLLASWVISYDPDARSLPGCGAVARARATGAVLGDAQARRPTPGHVLSSGSALFRLYRATDQVRYLELLRDTASNLAQYLPVAESSADAGSPAPSAAVRPRCPRIATADLLSGGPRPAAGMFDIMGLLTYSEIPGVYVRPDRRLVFGFDHVDASLHSLPGGELMLRLVSRASRDAAVRVVVETSDQAREPLPADAVRMAPAVVIAAGGVAEMKISGERS